jgi:hypothetical protein|tara:strand:- start:2945 stop:3538 length:594 start_codon:yes stop_codon:yes gene_type:complete
MPVTSTSADSPVDVSSRALILIGAEPLTSFDDGTNEALVASSTYEDVARAGLVNTRWRFATKQAQLSRLAAAPTGRYDAAYQLPSDSLMLHAVTVNDYPILYQSYADKIYCDATTSDVLIADYTFRVGEEDWPSYFVLAVEFSLASIFAISIARDTQLSDFMEQKAALAMAKARGLDSQQQTSRTLNTSRFVTQRRT